MMSRREVDQAGVLMQYGRTMLAVQIFEIQLAMVWLVLTHKERKGASFDDAMRKALRRLVHAVQIATPSGLRNELDGKIEADLLEEISKAVKWRDVLAHRYLRERLRNEPERSFKAGTLDQLESLTHSFEGTSHRLHELFTTAFAEMRAQAGGRPPDAFIEAMDEIARKVMHGSAYEDQSNSEDDTDAATS
jgi:hypothetical protein